jgi:steroid delta-isomerase-like uncharacterized protein
MKTIISLSAAFLACSLLMVSCTMVQKHKAELMKRQIEQYVTYWNTGEFEGIDELLAEDFEVRMTPGYEAETGIDTFMENITKFRKAYPDFYITIDEMIFSEEAVAGRWTITATNTGEGWHPPTGKSIEVPGMSIFHFADGKIKDEWIASNNILWLKQLGYTFQPPDFEDENEE